MIPNCTRVSISADSRFADQIEYTGGNQGTVISRKTIDRTVWYDVRFDNGYNNGYQFEDLMPLAPTNAAFKGLLEKEY